MEGDRDKKALKIELNGRSRNEEEINLCWIEIVREKTCEGDEFCTSGRKGRSSK